MPESRRARRKRARQTARRVPRRGLSAAARIGFAVGGVALIMGGIGLLAAGGPGTAERLGRIAGIAIVLGAAAIFIAVIGRAG